MISERTLKKWRKEALQLKIYLNCEDEKPTTALQLDELYNRILVLTQELIDNYLIKKGR
jgi:hypothetical protein